MNYIPVQIIYIQYNKQILEIEEQYSKSLIHLINLKCILNDTSEIEMRIYLLKIRYRTNLNNLEKLLTIKLENYYQNREP